ncbi:MAG TPA: response regulator transcription factor, partial [Nitrospira sp.]|nr:response regulator transcription factor [Nitrospira sp.]
MARANLIRVLLVDDHIMVRQGLRNVLQAYPNIEVVGEAGNGEEAVSIIGKLHPAVVVMDIIMPKMDGIAATRLIRTNYPDIAVLG